MSEIDVTKCKFHSTNNGFTGAYCTAHNNYCRHIRNCYFKQLHRYKQIVKEIKEIAEKVYKDCDDCYGDTDTNCDVDCIDCTLGGKAKLAEQILQKISEVENGATEKIKLDWKTAKYRVWNKQKKRWFYLVEQKSSLPLSQFLVEAKEDGELYFACSLHSSPWIWGEKERIK